MDCGPPGSSIHEIFQARVAEWVAISCSRWSFWPRDQIRVFRIVGRCFTIWATREILSKLGKTSGYQTHANCGGGFKEAIATWARHSPYLQSEVRCSERFPFRDWKREREREKVFVICIEKRNPEFLYYFPIAFVTNNPKLHGLNMCLGLPRGLVAKILHATSKSWWSQKNK